MPFEKKPEPKPTKYEHVFEDEDCISIWKYNTKITTNGPVEVEYKWKKHFNLIGSVKDASRTKVIEIYPTISPKLARKKDSNKADAILIGKYFIDNYKNDSFHG